MTDDEKDEEMRCKNCAPCEGSSKTLEKLPERSLR